MKPKDNQIEEARRYIANAKKVLLENTEIEGKFYDDPKYVKMAGNTAWNGVLVAMEAVFAIKSKGRHEIKNYIEEAAKIDGKVKSIIQNAYFILHRSLGYDGVLSTTIVKEGFADAKTIIDWCEIRYNPPVCGKEKITVKTA